MNINFESLKAEFKEYLESLGIKPKLNEDDELTSASIFTYSKEFKEFINYHLTTCERSDLLGASAHLLDIVTK